MIRVIVAWSLFNGIVVATESSTRSFEEKSSTSSNLVGTIYRRARADRYANDRYGSGDPISTNSGTIGVRSDPIEHRDAAYFESRCITCDPNKSTVADHGSRPRYDSYEDEVENRRYPAHYGNRYDDYEATRLPGYDYDRSRSPNYEHDRWRSAPVGYDYEGYDRFGRYDLTRPLFYRDDRYDNRYEDRDRRYKDRYYDRGTRGGGYYERGNGYDNIESRYPYETRGGNRYTGGIRRPYYYVEERNTNGYEGYNSVPYRRETNYEGYDRYDPRESLYRRRRPIDENNDRYYYHDRYGPVGGASSSALGFGSDGRGYYASGNWGPGYDKGYASAWNYAGGGGGGGGGGASSGGANRDNWRDRDSTSRDRDYERDRHFSRDREYTRDRDPGYYRPREYFYDSTAAPGGSRGTSYLHERQESSTASPRTGSNQNTVTDSPQPQRDSNSSNKLYKD